MDDVFLNFMMDTWEQSGYDISHFHKVYLGEILFRIFRKNISYHHQHSKVSFKIKAAFCARASTCAAVEFPTWCELTSLRLRRFTTEFLLKIDLFTPILLWKGLIRSNTDLNEVKSWILFLDFGSLYYLRNERDYDKMGKPSELTFSTISLNFNICMYIITIFSYKHVVALLPTTYFASFLQFNLRN